MYKFTYKDKRFYVPVLGTEQLEIAQNYFGDLEERIAKTRRDLALAENPNMTMAAMMETEVHFSTIMKGIRNEGKTLDLVATLIVEEGKEFDSDKIAEIRAFIKNLPAETSEAVLSDFFIKKEVQSVILGGYLTEIVQAMIQAWLEEVKSLAPIENP
jgi:hypothetical protein